MKLSDRLNVGKMDIRENKKQLLSYEPTENPCDLSYKYYELYWSKIKSENELINQRVTWFVLMNSFLFTAVGVILSTKTLSEVPSLVIIFSIMGVGISATAHMSVRAAIAAIVMNRAKFETLCDQLEIVNNRLPPLTGGGMNSVFSQRGSIFARAVPIWVGACWIGVIGLAAFHGYYLSTSSQ